MKQRKMKKNKMREREATVTLRAKDLVTDSDKTLFKGFVAGSVACEGEKRTKLLSTRAGFFEEFVKKGSPGVVSGHTLVENVEQLGADKETELAS